MARKPEPVDMPMATPCRLLCRLDSTGAYCTGCGRTRAELGAWRGMAQAERLAVMAALPARAAHQHERQP